MSSWHIKKKPKRLPAVTPLELLVPWYLTAKENGYSHVGFVDEIWNQIKHHYYFGDAPLGKSLQRLDRLQNTGYRVDVESASRARLREIISYIDPLDAEFAFREAPDLRDNERRFIRAYFADADEATLFKLTFGGE